MLTTGVTTYLKSWKEHSRVKGNKPQDAEEKAPSLSHPTITLLLPGDLETEGAGDVTVMADLLGGRKQNSWMEEM